MEEATPENTWMMSTDGASNAAGSGAGLILAPPDGGQPMKYALALTFRATNNEAEYEALVTGLRIARGTGVAHLRVRCDSELVVNQVKGTYAVKSPKLKKYVQEVEKLKESFQTFDIEAIPREENSEADALSKFALGAPLSPDHHIHFLEKVILSTTDCPEVLVIDHDAPTWMTPIYNFLASGNLPTDEAEANKLRRLANNYCLKNDILYKKGYTSPLLRCVAGPETEQILREVHEGTAACHEGARSIVRKILKLGYYWPTLNKDSHDLVKACDACQRYSPRINAPPAELKSIPSAWPFVQWGFDIVGPLPRSRGQLRFIIVAIDYFSKWIEAKPLAQITEANVMKFLRTRIVARYGIPRFFVSDNAKQFKGKKIEAFLEELGIQHRLSSVHHPQTNGQVESANRVILDGLKKNLWAQGGMWADKLDDVLWAVRTTPKKATGETPFGMVFGTEAVAPIEIAVPSDRVNSLDLEANQAARLLDLDLADEKRWNSEKTQAKMRLSTARYYNRRVKNRQFFVGELVLRRNEFIELDTINKMSPKWEGPYKIVEMPAPTHTAWKTLTATSLRIPSMLNS